METDPEKLKFILIVLLFDEDANDFGGISRERFILIFPKITNPNYVLFKGGGDVDNHLDLSFLLSDLEQVDADAYKQLVFIIVYDPSVLMINYEHKITEFDQMKVIELKKNRKDIELTLENQKEYIKRLIKQKLTVNIGRQQHETQKDFHELLLYGRLKAFTSAELEIMLCEVGQIDFEDLKANIYYISLKSI
ncbi:MAG: hypothetical protein EZS28_021142 [Streblomastix strix]|uniref:HECT-type E3 ubiquitin transferase n=1 Tax=Streblomastix strix TaxID=222440 RepID=A0A5J4VL72_9EUKA|nr:MAG: hypothetical protein EZS28_021142 [Streblomastix strix]